MSDLFRLPLALAIVTGTIFGIRDLVRYDEPFTLVATTFAIFVPVAWIIFAVLWAAIKATTRG